MHMILNACLGQQLPVDDPQHGVRTLVAACARRREQDGIVRMLFMLLDEQFHCLLRQCYLADGILRFWLRDHQFSIDTGDLFADRKDAVLHIKVIPLECQQLAPAQAAGQLQEEHGQDAVFSPLR